MSLRFHLFVFDVNQGNEETGWIQDFLVLPQGWKDSCQIFWKLLKIEDVIWKWGVGVFLERVFSFFFGGEVLQHLYLLCKYLSLFLAHLNNEPEFYILLYREVPVIIFYSREKSNLGTLYKYISCFQIYIFSLCFTCLLLYLLCFVCLHFVMFILSGVYVQFIWLIGVLQLLSRLAVQYSRLQPIKIFKFKAKFSDLLYFQFFFLSLVVVCLVLIIFIRSREKNNVLRCCLFPIMALLQVIGLFCSTREEIF